ncbi:MAG TPA: PIG-L family deacetylase [Ilumatobacteraceae bacterium]|nr:PIG-L family deacetylase [Ilumatobacteraceae bacterium]
MNSDRHLRTRGTVRDVGRHRHCVDQSGAAALIGNAPFGTVLAVWAHPDDESFVAGGLLAAASDAGSRIVCLTATRGELGTADADRWHPARLAQTRTRELAAAHAILGIDEQRWLPFEDGTCDTISPGRGMALVAQVIADVQPDTIVTFGPDGLTGHTDHQAVSRWTSHAWAAKGSSARLLWAAITADTKARMAAAEPVAKAFYPGYPSVATDHSVAIRLDLTGDLLDRKFSAIRAHATQSAALVHRLGEDRFRRWWATETYINVGSTSEIAPDDRSGRDVEVVGLHDDHSDATERGRLEPGRLTGDAGAPRQAQSTACRGACRKDLSRADNARREPRDRPILSRRDRG